MRIILCDDHPIVTISMTLLLESRGHEVVATANHPRSLSALVREHRPDACLLDAMYDGDPSLTAALAALDEVATLTDVIVVSGRDDPDLRRQVLEHGAVAVVCKSASSDDLADVIEGRSVTAVSRVGAGVANPHLLTSREMQVLQCLIDGESTMRIADHLHLSHATVRSHVQSILCKMGVHRRGAAVAQALTEGLTVSPL